MENEKLLSTFKAETQQASEYNDKDLFLRNGTGVHEIVQSAEKNIVRKNKQNHTVKINKKLPILRKYTFGKA